MAKTKRRQLAALAAQALRELTGGKERMQPEQKSGPSGSSSLDESGVEIRRQQVTFLIPALPTKAATDIDHTVVISKSEAPRKAKRKRNLADMNLLSAEPIPADEAKISKSILSLGKWKRRKKLTDLIHAVEQDTDSFKVADGQLHSAQSKGTGRNEALDRSVRGNGRLKGPPAPRSRLTGGPRKRMKLQELAESPAQETNSKSRRRRKRGSALHKTGNKIESSGLGSRDVLTETGKLQQSMNGCNGVLAGTPHLQRSYEARRGRGRKIASAIPSIRKYAEAPGPKPRTRALSTREALAVQGFQDLQRERISHRPDDNDRSTPGGDTQLAGLDFDRAGKAREDDTLAEQQNTENFSGKKMQTSVANANNPPLHQPGQHSTKASHPIRLHQDLPLQSRREAPAPGGQEGFENSAKRGMQQHSHYPNGKSSHPRQAELIKRNSRLASMSKRLDAAGGLQKWLLSNNLDKFVPIFEQMNIDHPSLLQLTMEELKSLGVLPVGPRRKLIHAIDSLTLPALSKSFRL